VREPRARRSPREGAGTLERGGAHPREREPSSEAEPARGGGVSPRARRTLLEGVPCWATLVGRGGHRSVGLCCVRMFCVMFKVCLCFVFFAGFKQDSSGFLGDPRGCPRQ
jgi:hypothetical protein